MPKIATVALHNSRGLKVTLSTTTTNALSTVTLSSNVRIINIYTGLDILSVVCPVDIFHNHQASAPPTG